MPLQLTGAIVLAGHLLTAAPDTTGDTLVHRYLQSAGSSLRLYQGVEYTGSYPGTTGHPYFGTDSLQTGSIQYDGIHYPGIPLRYDLVRDELIILSPGNLAMRLHPEKVRSFSLGPHRFVQLADTASRPDLVAGFYEQLEEGPMEVLVRRWKQVERVFDPADPDIFRQYARYFIRKEGIVYGISSEKALLALMGEDREAVRRFLRSNRLSFRKDPARALTETARFYAQLKK